VSCSDKMCADLQVMLGLWYHTVGYSSNCTENESAGSTQNQHLASSAEEGLKRDRVQSVPHESVSGTQCSEHMYKSNNY
jgi:hypothetical protein